MWGVSVFNGLLCLKWCSFGKTSRFIHQRSWNKPYPNFSPCVCLSVNACEPVFERFPQSTSEFYHYTFRRTDKYWDKACFDYSSVWNMKINRIFTHSSNVKTKLVSLYVCSNKFVTNSLQKVFENYLILKL